MERLGTTLRLSPTYQRFAARFPPLDEPEPEPKCTLCGDLRYVAAGPRTDDWEADRAHPNFGKAKPCPSCYEPELRQKRLDRLFGALPGAREWTLDSCEAFLAERARRGQVVEPRDLVQRLRRWQGAGDRWLWLFGPVGLCKTSLAAALARVEIEAGRTVAYRTVPRLLDRIKETFDRSEATEDVLRDLYEADVLLLDDLGKERRTDFSAEVLFKLIDERHKAQLRGVERRTLVTSNLPWWEVAARYDDAAFVDRIREHAGEYVIELRGSSLRTESEAA